MNFEFTPQQKQLRRDVQAFIAENMTEALRAELKDDARGSGPEGDAFFEKIMARGWTAVSWPKEYGGQGGSPMDQFIIEEEFQRIGYKRIGGGGTGAPAILASGTEEQKRQFVPATIKGEISFSQGYSEPGCGTDLAGIQCRALRQGETYVINGQKIYTTSAHACTHIFLMVRTDPQSKRQAGLSILLVPMRHAGHCRSPALDHPERTPRTDAHHLWRATHQRGVPRQRRGSRLVPARRGGRWLGGCPPRPQSRSRWRLALPDLGHARRGHRQLAETKRTAQRQPPRRPSGARQGGRALDRGPGRPADDDAQHVHHPTRSAFLLRRLRRKKSGRPSTACAPPRQSARFSVHRRKLLNGSPDALEDGVFAHNLLGAFQSTVNHGSVQVMRDQIARNGLGMPRAPVAARVPPDRGKEG